MPEAAGRYALRSGVDPVGFRRPSFVSGAIVGAGRPNRLFGWPAAGVFGHVATTVVGAGRPRRVEGVARRSVVLPRG